MGTRSSTQARSHAQKFFVKLEKKNLTMEGFLETVNMSNLRSIIENDSDYGSETDKVSRKGASQMSLSVTSSVKPSQSVALSTIKSTKSTK